MCFLCTGATFKGNRKWQLGSQTACCSSENPESPLFFSRFAEADVHMCITSECDDVLCVARLLRAPQPCHTKQHVKMWPIWSPFCKWDWLSCMEARAHPQNTNKENHMRGDELGKLHNIFIRYYFTCLVDGLQGDTLKTNVEPRGEKRSLVNTGLRRRNMELPNQMNNNCRVFWSHKCDRNKLCVNHAASASDWVH